MIRTSFRAAALIGRSYWMVRQSPRLNRSLGGRRGVTWAGGS
jgi:hypothetical protein